MNNLNSCKKDECIHNPNISNSSLIMLAKRTMSYPPEFDYFCPKCQETFRFYRNENGEFVFKNT